MKPGSDTSVVLEANHLSTSTADSQSSGARPEIGTYLCMSKLQVRLNSILDNTESGLQLLQKMGCLITWSGWPTRLKYWLIRSFIRIVSRSLFACTRMYSSALLTRSHMLIRSTWNDVCSGSDSSQRGD